MTTMIQSEDPAIHVGIVGAQVWADALEKITAGAVPQDDPDLLAFWEAAGILRRGELDQMWASALRVVQESTVGSQLISTYGKVVFRGTIMVEGEHAVCLTERGVVGANEDGERIIQGLDPMIEVAIAPAGKVWKLVRRVLPPLEELRHEPKAAKLRDEDLVTLEGLRLPPSMVAKPETFASELHQLPNLPPRLVDLFDARAQVFAFTYALDDDGARTSSKAWALGKRLYMVDSDENLIWQVPAGQLGATIVAALREA